MVPTVREQAAEPPLPARWLNWHAAGMIVGAAAGSAFGRGAFLAIPALLSFTALWPHRPPRFGLANLVTLTRLVIVALATFGLQAWRPAWVTMAFVLNVILDAVDGRVARGLGETTQFGVVFDREVDAFFVLSAYVYFYFSVEGLGPWVLLPGMLPYLYRLSVRALRVPESPAKKERLAAPLAGLNFTLLLAALALPERAVVILLVSFLVVLTSFSASFWNLYRHAYSLS